jgi:hypothetical protein
LLLELINCLITRADFCRGYDSSLGSIFFVRC